MRGDIKFGWLVEFLFCGRVTSVKCDAAGAKPSASFGVASGGMDSDYRCVFGLRLGGCPGLCDG